MVKICFLLAALVAAAFAIPYEQYYHDPEAYQYQVQYDPEEVDSPVVLASHLHRLERSAQGGIPDPRKQGGWSVNPTVNKDQGGNTRTNVEVQHKGKDHDFNAGWGKVVDGPGRAKPTWHVGGTVRW